MNTRPIVNCYSCRHFHELSPQYGECRRFPPQVVAVALKNEYEMEYTEVQSQYPALSTTAHGCGEHEDYGNG